MQRRHFLQTLSGTGATLWLSGLAPFFPILLPSKAQAQERTVGTVDRTFFVLIRVTEGWDVTLGLDPRVHVNGSTQQDIFLEYGPEKIRKAGALSFGPAAASLIKHASDLAVINGVFMSESNFGHPENLLYMSTGSGTGTAPSLPIELAAAGGAGPFGVVFTGDLHLGARAVVPSTVENILSLRNAIDFSSLSAHLRSRRAGHQLRQAQLSLANDRTVLEQLRARLDALEAHLSNSNGNDVTETTRRAAAVAAASFASGAAFQAQIDLRTELDTHSNHEGRHMAELTKSLDAVSSVFDLFKQIPWQSGTLFEKTTFMVVSEFSRTPFLNTSKGKDHNPLTNSVLLAGAGIKGGQTIGQSRVVTRRRARNGVPRHVAVPVSYRTGAVAQTRAEAESGEFQYILPENVVATVARAARIDPTKFTSVSSQTPVLASILS